MKRYVRPTTAAVALMAAIAAEARDAELLMLAAKINYMRAVESRCEQVAPGYSSKFQASYAKAKGTLLDRVGVDEALVDEAEKTPELAVAELVAKFDRAGAEKQKQYCEMNLQDLKVFTE